MDQLKFKIEGIRSRDDKFTIETEIDVLSGVKTVEVSEKTGLCAVDFDGQKISEEEIYKAIEKLGFSKWETKTELKEHVYQVGGMHCASCEILIEKKLLDLPGVKSVEASTNKGRVVVEYEGESRPNPHKLNKIFSEDNYIFSDLASPKSALGVTKAGERISGQGANPTLVAFNIALAIIIGFLILQRAGIADVLNVSSKSSVFAFLGLGILAGISSCAALVGGMVLSMSKQWQGLYGQNESLSRKFQPHVMFNAGRVISYAVLGGVLGMIGSRLQISPQFTSFLVIAISFLMLALGLQMLGVKQFRKFQFSLPKGATRYIANEKNFQGKQMPFIMGALTFFLPCGFTITSQSLALLSGSAAQGALIMGAFALGTAPSLLLIGLSSVKFSSKPHLAEKFAKVAGFLVLFFALFNLNGQMNVLGFTGFGDIFSGGGQQIAVDAKDLPKIVEGKQIVKMNASSRGYSPNYIKVRAGVPVRWEITDTGTSGCTNAIISKSLFDGQIDLTPGQVAVKEFTPQKSGKYKFSCWMGMVSGTIEVVDAQAAAVNVALAQTARAAAAPAGSACGGGGGGCGCGGGAKIEQDPTPTVALAQGDAQVINTTYTASNYLSPNSFEVKAGTKVKLSIDVKDSGSGCASQIMVPGLYDNAQNLRAGKVLTLDFMPSKPGKYDITCGMGMIRFGTISVN